MPRQTTEPGRYYLKTPSGLRPLGDVQDRPDVVICRRVSDYGTAGVPRIAQIGACSLCHAPIAFDPTGPHQDVPRACMQCKGIRPLPIPDR